MKLKGIVMSALIIAAVLAAFSAPAAANYTFDGYELENMVNGTVQGGVFVKYGDRAGLANDPYVTNYSVPAGSGVKWARLYVGIWGGTDERKGWVNTTFNGHWEGNASLNSSEDTATYSSGTNVYGSGWGVWTVSYNCTDNVTLGATNTANVTTGGGIDGRVYGIVLVVVYENSSLPKVQYWVNEGNVNLHGLGEGGFPSWELNNNVTWFNGTAYNCTEAKQTVLYYTGSTGEHDYLYLNAPYAYDSPYNLSNISWDIDGYRRYQLNSNDVANAYSDLTCTCDDDSVSTSYFDLNCFSRTNDSTPLCDIINHTGNNYAIFWRGHDDNNSGAIDGTFNASGIEGEAYVHPIVAALVLKDITRVYDFGVNYTGTPGEDAWAFKYQVDGSPGAGDPSIVFNTTEYNKIKKDDGDRAINKTSTDGYYAAHRFNFSIDEAAADIEKINVTWNGIGDHDTATDGAKLYIYNFTAGSYEQLDSTTLNTEVTLTGEKTSSISSYINAGNVTILVKQTSAQIFDEETEVYRRSHIETDYVRLVVTPDP